MGDMWWEAERYAEYMGEGIYDEPPNEEEAVKVPKPEPLIEEQPEEDCPF